MTSLPSLFADLRVKRPDITPFALGSRSNRHCLDLEPAGQRIAWFSAEDHPALVESYLQLNHLAFPALPVPRWVLSDLYLLPGAIVGWMGDPAHATPEARSATPTGYPLILSAWVGAPTVEPGTLIGVSLISFSAGLGVWAKLLGTRVHRARRVRGMAQWGSASLRAHTRLGPMRVLGPAPGGHELNAASFTYETDLGPPEALALRFAGGESASPSPGETRLIPKDDLESLRALTAEARDGATVLVVPPGLDRRGNIVISLHPER